MMKRREALVAMAGAATVAATWTRSGSGAWQKPPEELTLPELMKVIGPMMATIPVKAEPLAPGITLITGPGGNITALGGPDGTLMVDSFIPGQVTPCWRSSGRARPTGRSRWSTPTGTSTTRGATPPWAKPG